MFAQANPEHCRHKIFNATLGTSTAPRRPKSLLQMIKNTYELHSAGILSAYKDNSAVFIGSRGGRFYTDPRTNAYVTSDEDIHLPARSRRTTIRPRFRPFPAPPPAPAARSATKAPPVAAPSPRPASPVSPSRTSVCPARRPACRGKRTTASPAASSPALDIMLEGPLGGAAFNNEFGRPAINGYFRTFRAESAGGCSRGRSTPEPASARPATRNHPPPNSAATTSPSCSPAASATSATSTCRRGRSTPATSSSSSAARPC